MEVYDKLEQHSPVRCNVVKWMDIPENAQVLEIGCVSEVVTEYLHQNVQQVTSASRWDYEMQRNQFDFIILWGSLPIIDSKTEPEIIELMLGMLKKEGKLVLAVDNKYGLKYWAGCKEEGQKECFTTLTHNSSMSKSKAQLDNLLSQAGVQNFQFFYPYPDHRFASTIYSDECLPKKGELSTNDYPYFQERLQLFQEDKVYDNLIEDGMFPLFSNSFLLVVERN